MPLARVHKDIWTFPLSSAKLNLQLMEPFAKREQPIAVFMAFGTQGDVYPLAAIAAAFAAEMAHYSVFFITHSAHQNLSVHLAKEHVTYLPITSPPVLSFHEKDQDSEMVKTSISTWRKKAITNDHRQQCVSAVERIFGLDEVLNGDFILINFFALEGWSLAELFQVQCVVAAPYVVPYSAPASFESCFQNQFSHLYGYLIEAPINKICWKDIMHWMWPLFTENWGSWRSKALNLSPIPFTDPVTGLPTWHERAPSPTVMYGFNEDIVECPDYWPSNIRISGFWFLPDEWQFSCQKCYEAYGLHNFRNLKAQDHTCPSHVQLHAFLNADVSVKPVFIGLSSIGRMGFLMNPRPFLLVLKEAATMTGHRFILFTASYEPLDAAILDITSEEPSSSSQTDYSEHGRLLFGGQLFCFCGSIPYKWLFQQCAAAIHHGGSGSTAAALHAGIPQVICPFMLDQFYWAERMFWLGVAPAPLKRRHLLPDDDDDVHIKEAALILSKSIYQSLSREVKARALEISSKISIQDGVAEAVKILKKEVLNEP
ncbi:hypothetical protein SAY87_014182 [Trapa incisa]|uniref:Erythromycin biosynthesis protein CIII-like C-terminal domain-containing protein n=1 Tax=Trapa incisa TaxID=236973 RepID=A0AAN7GJJ8_9MYRT|nr:hypothetical protein SAY87_014182 [Trapa incisa]